jgi:hypothetical protein
MVNEMSMKIKVILAMLGISMLASVGMAYDFSFDGNAFQKFQEMSFSAEGREVTVSFTGNPADNQGILLVFATDRHIDGVMDLADLQGSVHGSAIFTLLGDCEVLSQEEYDGNPYTFSAEALMGEGDIYAVLIRDNGKVSMGKVPYLYENEALNLGEEVETPVITDDREGYSLQNYDAQKEIRFLCVHLTDVGSKRMFVQFSGEPKEGIVIICATNKEDGKTRLIGMDGSLPGQTEKIRLDENFFDWDNEYDFNAEDLGEEPGNLYAIMLNKDEGAWMGTVSYSLNEEYILAGNAVTTPKI